MKWIDAYDLSKIWAGRRDCQQTLPILARKLIRAHSNSIKSIHFPGGENVLIGGWDGILEVTEETEYLPMGTSCWEFGANQKVKDKADKDYEKRSNNSLGCNPSESTYIFVTPRLWKAGAKWAEEKRKEGIWKDVRVYNSEILEEWIEISPTVGAWLAKHIGKYPVNQLQPTDDFWEEWSSGEKYKMNAEILLGGRDKEKETVIELINKPGISAIKSLSESESLAFIIACFKGSNNEEDFFSRSIIVNNKEAFRELCIQNKPLILIPRFDDLDVVNSALQKKHTVIVPLGAEATENWGNKIELPKIERDSFVSALKNMGIPEELAEKYSLESARNITILRRQLGFNKTLPEWALPENVSDIIPALIVGKWNENFENDKKIISKIANDTYENYIRKLSKWMYKKDAPILKIGNIWRLTSPWDSWTNVSEKLMGNDFESLVNAVFEVLSEINPSFELPSEKRYLAQIYGKNWAHSKEIREGLIQSLILTSIFGKKSNCNLPIDAEIWVDNIVEKLLQDEDPNLWKSFNDIMPEIAEASPTKFLEYVKKYISVENSPIIKLFDEDPGLLQSHSYYFGLLWALESLAWFPRYLLDVSIILAKLSVLDPGGSWSNRPIHSLSQIFKSWHYQTLAKYTERIQVLKVLAKREPEVAWELLMGILPDSRHDTASFTQKTRWRMFEVETKLPVTYKEIYDTYSEVVDLLISICDFGGDKMSQLIDKSDSLSTYNRDKILSFIGESISKIKHDKQLLWHECRKKLYEHRSYPDADWALPESELNGYQKLYEKLMPENEIDSVMWMFETFRPEFPEGFDHTKDSYEEHEKIIHKKRVDALTEIYRKHGIEKIIELLESVENAKIFGDILAYVVDNEDESIRLCKLLETDLEYSFIQSYILRKTQMNGINWAFQMFGKLKDLGFKNSSLTRLLIPLNQTCEVWDFINSKNQEIIQEYWKNVIPRFYRGTTDEKIYGLMKLVEHDRYISAVHMCSHFVTEVSSDLIMDILKKAATKKSEEMGTLEPYAVNKLFKTMDIRQDIGLNNMVTMEWLYLPILASYDNEHKPKRLYNELSTNPEFFMEVLKYVYKPENDTTEQFDDLSEEQVQNRAKYAWRLFESWNTIPGVNVEGKINYEFLEKWVNDIRELATKHGRLDVADIQIGKILAKYPEEQEKIWPPEEICEIIEIIDSEELNDSFYIAILNKNGMISRGVLEGGDIERKHAKYYSELADEYMTRYPNVTRIFEKLSKRYLEDAKKRDEEVERSKLEY
ncbi:hypothetical protein [Methanococcus maripaludis]|uniref:Uncharacterized protein n=1 Tax=Methanococcus maripaludis TaxID=39152 RepID=A0A7J9PCX5_METMI|nr:hypothetical protein [Methanococcus maripaludis]MBA2861103.1 hypothetical protein [Methanococcus maripaludis]